MGKKDRSANEGIQANNVSAEVMAVGHGAKAVKNVKIVNHPELANAVSAFREALDELKLDVNSRRVVQEDLDKLEKVAQEQQPDKQEVGKILQSISGKLKMVGVVLTETLNLVEPIRKIASFFGTTINLLAIL